VPVQPGNSGGALVDAHGGLMNELLMLHVKITLVV
jgi:S1-C subfamily serine protease